VLNQVTAEFVAVIVTAILGAIGAFYTHNYAKQTRNRLAEARRVAYAELWEITGLAAPTRLDPGGRGLLSLRERNRLYRELTSWYYRHGNGMLLDRITREVYLNAKRNLLSAPRDLKPSNAARFLCANESDESLSRLPDDLRDDLRRPFELRFSFHNKVIVAPVPKRLKSVRKLESHTRASDFYRVRDFSLLDLLPKDLSDDEKQGCLSIRQLSLLRTQMKTDLAIYGVPWVKGLHLHERAFLRYSGVCLSRNPLVTVLTWVHLRDPNPWVDAAKLPVPDECCGGETDASGKCCRPWTLAAPSAR
jgi:hypothetical protein